MTYSKEVLDLNPQLRGIAENGTETPSKYHNTRTDAKGLRFASGHEAGVIVRLIDLEERKQGVFGLRLQVRFPLPGKVIYVADATYLDENLEGHVVDAKGVRTPEYKLKKKLFKETYGRDIEEL